jgi:hypothetical protein
MQKMDLRDRLRVAYKVLKTIVEASRDMLDEYIHSEIIQGIKSDIDLYFQKSKNIKERPYEKVGGKRVLTGYRQSVGPRSN